MRKRSGSVLMLAVFFVFITLIMSGFIVDYTRITLAKIQLHNLVDTVALTVVANHETKTYSDERRVYLISNPNGDGYQRFGCEKRGEWGGQVRWEWNSIFPPSGEDRIPFQATSSPTNKRCATLDDVVDLIVKLHHPDTLSSVQFRNFSGRPIAYQFDYNTVSVRIDNIDDGGQGTASVQASGSAVVPLTFASLLGIREVHISASSGATVEFFT